MRPWLNVGLVCAMASAALAAKTYKRAPIKIAAPEPRVDKAAREQVAQAAPTIDAAGFLEAQIKNTPLTKETRGIT